MRLLFKIDRLSTGLGGTVGMVHDLKEFNDIWERVLKLAPQLASWKKWALQIGKHTFPAVSSSQGGASALAMLTNPTVSMSEAANARSDRIVGGRKRSIADMLTSSAIEVKAQDDRIVLALGLGSARLGRSSSGGERAHTMRFAQAAARARCSSGGGGGASSTTTTTTTTVDAWTQRIDHFTNDSSQLQLKVSSAIGDIDMQIICAYAHGKGLRTVRAKVTKSRSATRVTIYKDAHSEL